MTIINQNSKKQDIIDSATEIIDSQQDRIDELTQRHKVLWLVVVFFGVLNFVG
jgi:type IV secretory pathway component VirB8